MDEATEPDIVDDDGEPKRNFRRVLEDKAREAEERAATLEAEVASMRRVEAFRAAGIDPNDTRQAYFVKGYDGEVDAEAIRAAASEAGFLGTDTGGEESHEPPEVTSETITYREELLAQGRVADAGVQGQPVAAADLQDRIRATRSSEELHALLRSEGIAVNTQG